MILLIFLTALLGVCGLAYYWGPDDVHSKRFTIREKSALSISLGLGVALPWVTASYDASLYTFVGIIIISLLAAARAGKRPFLHAHLASTITSGCWYIMSVMTGTPHTDTASIIASIIALMGIASFFLALPSVIVYPFWERRRRANRTKQHARPHVPDLISVSTTPVPAVSGHPTSIPASQSVQQISLPPEQQVTRQ